MKKRKSLKIISLLLVVAILIPVLPVYAAEEPEKITRMEALLTHIENTLKYGRNIPGSKEPNLFIDGMNVETREPIVWKQNGKVYVPAEFMGTQNLMRLLYGLTALTGDPSYKQIAVDQYKYVFDNYTDNNGLIYWGCHAFVDVMTGKPILDGNAHEVKYSMIPYDIMFDADPEGAARYVTAMWNAHFYDMPNMRLDRHGYFNEPMQDVWSGEYTSDDPLIESIGPRIPFFSTVNDMISAATALAKYTDDDLPLIWADRLWQRRAELTDSDTGLVGSQYGTYGADGGDRAFVQFGPEYGDSFTEYNWITRDTIKSIGYDPYAYIPYAELTNNQEVKDAMVKQTESFQEILYDAEKNTVRAPILSDGTSMEGLVVPRDGYFGNEGTVFYTDSKGGAIFAMELNGPVYVYTKVEQTEKIWQVIRDFAKNNGLGDVGTAPGENVDLNIENAPGNSYYTIAMVDLYNYSGCQDYLDMAVAMADKMIEKNFRNGVFAYWGGPYTQFGSQDAVAVMIVEAAVQGKSDLVTEHFNIGSFDTTYDGYGRTSMETVAYGKKRKAPETIEMDRKELSFVVDTSKNYIFEDTAGHWAETQIKEMASAGIMEGRDDGKFYPDDYVTRAEFAKMINASCNFSDVSMPVAWYTDVAKTDWYYEDALKAKNARLFDNAITLDKYFGGDEVLTREQMASVLVRALQHINPKNDYTTVGSIDAFEDTDDISDWAKEYMDIAYSQRIMKGISSTELAPQNYVTRAQAACAIRAFQKVSPCEDIVQLNANITNDDCTDTRITWATSDKNIVDVDSMGNLFPVGVGEATITANAEGSEASDTAKITITPVEDWMVRKITIDGAKLVEFEPTKFVYNIDLPIGTTQIPDVKAMTYSGEKANISKPTKIPGTMKIYLPGAGEDKTYELNFTANKVEYIVNTTFDDSPVDTRAVDLRDGDLLWSIYHTDYVNKLKVVEKPVPGAAENTTEEVPVEGGTEAVTDKCLAVSYNEEYKYLMEARGKFTAVPVKLGEEAPEDMVTVMDFDMMLDENATYTLLQIGNGKNNSYLHTFRFEGTSLFSLATNQNTAAKYKIGSFTNFKFVIDERTKKLDIYVDGKKAVSNLMPSNSAIEELSAIEFNMRVNLPTAPTLYIDNLKIYEVSKAGLEASFTK